MTIEITRNGRNFLVSRLADGANAIETVRFARESDADEFAELWRDWLRGSAQRRDGRAKRPRRARIFRDR